VALEATLLVELEPAVGFTVADGAGIEKGSFLKIADPNTVSQAGADNDAVVGIAAEEKIASDGKTTIGVYLRGIFKGTIGAGGCTAGDALICDSGTGDDNEMATADVNSEQIIGRALETGTDLQTIKFLLQPLVVNLA